MEHVRVCERCGHGLLHDALYCPQCGEHALALDHEDVSEKSRLVALLFAAILGHFGAHRFYVGKTGTGILWLLTGGLFGIGYLVDLIMIAAGWFRDSLGLRVVLWDEAPVGGQVSERSRMLALLLCVFLGYLGIHRFYVGKIGSGIIYLLTGGLIGVGWLIDVSKLINGTFCDDLDLPVAAWDHSEQSRIPPAPAH